MQHPRRFRPGTALTGCALLLALVATPAVAGHIEKGIESAHQPVVERTDFIFDVVAGSDGVLAADDARRLAAWFNALDLRYGDRVTIAGSTGYSDAGVRGGIGDLVARHGLLVSGEAPVTVAAPPVGSLRVVVSRSTATVTGCPDWRDKSDMDLVGGQASNYGCATAANLAAMIADPRDLVEGRKTDTDLKVVTSSRAIQVYRDKAPSGASGLQAMSAGGH